MKVNGITSKRRSDFFKQLNLSASTTRHYKEALKSDFLKDIVEKECQKSDIFEITDLNLLWKIYSMVNLHPHNIRVHRAFSSAIMKYIRFLNNGKKYGNRIDFNTKRNRRV